MPRPPNAGESGRDVRRYSHYPGVPCLPPSGAGGRDRFQPSHRQQLRRSRETRASGKGPPYPRPGWGPRTQRRGGPGSSPLPRVAPRHLTRWLRIRPWLRSRAISPTAAGSTATSVPPCPLPPHVTSGFLSLCSAPPQSRRRTRGRAPKRSAAVERAEAVHLQSKSPKQT